MLKNKLWFHTCKMLAKKINNTKSDNKTIDFVAIV